MARRARRWLVRGVLIAVALGAVAMALLPWWWPPVVARFANITIGDWETSGWSTVELRDVAYEQKGLRVTAARVRVPAFGRWPRSEDGLAIVAQDVVVTPPPAQEPSTEPSMRRVVADVLRAWPTLQRWLPAARVDGITIATPTPIAITTATWDGDRLHATGSLPGRTEATTITLHRPGENEIVVEADVSAWSVGGRASATLTADGLAANVDLRWREQQALLTAEFAATGLLPASAAVDASSLEVPSSQLGLQGYGPVRGSVQGSWSGQKFSTTIAAQTDPTEGGENLPPLAIDIRASGDTTHVQFDSVLIHIPGVEATLSQPVVFTLPGTRPNSPAEFALTIDLAQLPRSPAQGKAVGRVTLASEPAAADFSFTAESVRWRDAEIRALDFAGRWEPGIVRLHRGTIRGADDSTAEFAGEFDLANQRIAAATVKAKVSSAALRPWLPKLPEFATLAIEGHAEGPLNQFKHAGTLQITGLAGVPGGTIDGDVTWGGEAARTISVQGEARSGSGVAMPFAAAAQRADNGAISGEVTQLAWRDAEGEWWTLRQPAQVRFGGETMALEGLDLAGEGVALRAGVEVRWPASGRLTVDASGVAATRLAAFLPAAGSHMRVDDLKLSAEWADGPVQLNGAVRATYAPDADAAYSVETEFRTESDRLAFGAVRVLDASGVVLQGEGRLPFSLSGQADGFHVALPRDGELSLTLSSTPNPKFWESITRLTKWQVSAPEVSAELSGTLASPRGRIEFATATVQPPPGFAHTIQLPQIGDVRLVVVAGDEGLEITQGIFTLDGNWVSLHGKAPWDLWQNARAQGIVPWRAAEFAFSADRMPMTVASQAEPTLFAPEGDVSFSLRHAPSRGFEGFVILAGASLRALPPLGAVRDIAGRVDIAGYDVRLPQLEALIGGRPIRITGEADVSRVDRPTFDVRLVSARVPLVRQEGLVLRAGMNVQVVQTADKPAHITGAVELGQSVFVSDLVSLLPNGGNVTAPERRPPYFSVREPPFADWTLDVTVKGDEFLRIENPFFNGTISADFHLDGTLREPRAIGRASSTRGTIVFPFGRLRIEQLEVSLTEQNPYTPTLYATAGTRLYGYDVRLEASGNASDPRLLFTSDPPLPSQAVFLMLSTGEIPDTTNAFSTNERAQRLALFVGRNLASSLGLGSSGSDGEEKLIVRSGEDFSREGGETLYVQYNLDGRWSIVAEKDRFDAYNGGIKFRVLDR